MAGLSDKQIELAKLKHDVSLHGIAMLAIAGTIMFISLLIYKSNNLDRPYQERRELRAKMGKFDRPIIEASLKCASEGDLMLFEKMLTEEQNRRRHADIKLEKSGG